MTEFLEEQLLRLGDKWIILPIIFKLVVTYVRKKSSSLEILEEVRFFNESFGADLLIIISFWSL